MSFTPCFFLAAVLLYGAFGGLMAFSSPKNPSPYVGSYSSNHGGGDAMSRTHLTILPDGRYAFVYFGGLQTGTWRELPNGKLRMQESRDASEFFYVYARHDDELADGTIVVNFDQCAEGSAKVSLPATKNSSLALQLIFNSDANCYATPYQVTLPAKTYAIQLLETNDFKKYLAEYERPAVPDNLLYTFAIDKRYNYYKAYRNQTASQEPAVFIGEVIEGRLLLYQGGKPSRPEDYGEKDPLTKEKTEEIEDIIRMFNSATAPVMQEDEEEQNTPQAHTYHRLPGNKRALEPTALSAAMQQGKPLFEVRCHDPASTSPQK